MNRYASTYISGLGEPIEEWLRESYDNVKIINNYDGLVIYETNQDLISLPFFNNTFLVLNSIRGGEDLEFDRDIKRLVSDLSINFDVVNKLINTSHRTFKITAFDRNQPTRLDYSIVRRLEHDITRFTKLKLGTKTHDTEFQIIRRSEGIILLLLKLSYHRQTEKNISQGSLRPELAYSLSRLADIAPTDIVMDMFCGSGAIPKAIVKHFNYNMIFASDIDEGNINKLKQEFKNNKKKLYIKLRDARDLSYFEDDFIDKIVTDPPWNIYNKTNTSFTPEYISYLREIARIMKPTGKAVILMGNTLEFENALEETNLLLIKKYNILVNGKKANIYILKKVQT